MRELPTKTRDVVGISRLNGRHSSRPDAARLERDGLPTVPAVGAARVPLKLLRFPAVRERTGLSRSTIWRLERRGEFPQHHRIAPNVVAWVEEDVAHWIDVRTNRVAS